MAIDLKTLKRGSSLLEQKLEGKFNDVSAKPINKKAGRKKVDEEIKLTEKVVTYVTKREYLIMQTFCQMRGFTMAQTLRYMIKPFTTPRDEEET